ncbi:leukocyte immunoglobulin-like receptor subfamily B member 1 [Pteropus vampyrus]|uniref:Leukocyte immunoglobulin-like receptor subfamily B member 1 n=1 Tax=Pteropus vampyrus TaxID=132908 RepID=A0A6P6C3L8_PTEVA|nr:leukocyte immunoglobulin-like receptor subfamily B member 1 [Pteropus vampyrus]
MGPASTSHGGTYRCYGSHSSYVYEWSEPSDLLRLEVTGVHREPSLSAQPGTLVLSGDRLVLQCHSEAGFGRFALTKDEGLTPPQRLDGQHSPDFPLGPMTRNLGGQYRCYSGHNLSYAWSAPSAPLDILITGMYKKPSLSAHPGPSVPWGGKVTLRCRSETLSDTFYLHKEGSPAPPQRFRPQDTAASFQANFTMNPVTSAHGGTYRCYSSRSTSPYLLSHPSDPVEFVVSVYLHKEGSPAPPQRFRPQDTAASFQANFTMNPVTSAHGGTYRCYSSRSTSPYLLSHPSDPVEFVVSVSRPGGLTQRHQDKSSDYLWSRSPGDLDHPLWFEDVVTDPMAHGRYLIKWHHWLIHNITRVQGLKRYLNILIGVLVALVLLFSLLLFLLLRHWRQSKRRMSVAASEPEDRGLQKSSGPAADVQENLYAAVKDTPDDGQLDSQAVASEDLQDVTYAQLNHGTLRREISALPSSSEPPDEPSLYAALAIH